MFIKSLQLPYEVALVLPFNKKGNQCLAYGENKITNLLVIKPGLESKFLNSKIHSL